MNVFDCFVGIDSSKSDFAAAIYRDPKQKVTFRDKMANNVEGFQEFLCWMQSHQLNTDQTLICVEATGVYSEAICYYLHQHNFQVWLEAPQKVKHAFKVSGHKTDPVDAGLIAEYAFRYTDRYRRWQPKHDILEQLGTLLATRELITQNRTALSNAFSAFNRKCCKTCSDHAGTTWSWFGFAFRNS